MPMNFTGRLATALIAVAMALPLAAQQAEPEDSISELEKKSREAYDNGEHLHFYIANQKLHQQRPFEPSYTFNIARACALFLAVSPQDSASGNPARQFSA